MLKPRLDLYHNCSYNLPQKCNHTALARNFLVSTNGIICHVDPLDSSKEDMVTYLKRTFLQREITCEIVPFPIYDLFNLFFYWRIIALQNLVAFCQTSTWISHRCTHILLNVPFELPSNLPPHPSPLGQYRAPLFLSQTANSPWLSISHILHMDITRWSTPKSDILCSQRWRSSIQSAKTRPGADCGSDHELLVVQFRLKLKKVGKTTRPFIYNLNQSLMIIQWKWEIDLWD